MYMEQHGAKRKVHGTADLERKVQDYIRSFKEKI